MVERSFGKGRVVAFLTTAAPTWNNWARNPSFVVAMQDLQAYLASRPAGVARRVGAPLEVPFSAADYRQQVGFVTPIEAVPPVDAARTADGQWLATLPATDRSGFYEARLTNKTTGKTESRRYAVNVDAAEGDLRALFGEELAETPATRGQVPVRPGGDVRDDARPAGRLQPRPRHCCTCSSRS